MWVYWGPQWVEELKTGGRRGDMEEERLLDQAVGTGIKVC